MKKMKKNKKRTNERGVNLSQTGIYKDTATMENFVQYAERRQNQKKQGVDKLLNKLNSKVNSNKPLPLSKMQITKKLIKEIKNFHDE